jgi:hypothetical protein
VTTTERAALGAILYYAWVLQCSPAAAIGLASWAETHFHWTHKLHNV